MTCPVDGVFRSELVVILMTEWGSWQKFQDKKRAMDEIFNGIGEPLS